MKRLADHLHVAVFDSIVHHLDVMAGSIRSDIGCAWHASGDGAPGTGAFDRFAGIRIHLCGNRHPDVPDLFPGILGATRHEGRTETGSFFTATYSGTYEMKVLLLQASLSENGVRPFGVPPIDHDVRFVEKREE